jgi:hypothetical protein
MLILMVSPILAVMAGQGHWPLTPTKARVNPSGAALTHPTFQLYVLVIAFGFEVAVALALVVAVVLIVEHAVKTDVLDSVDVISVVELEDEVVTLELEDEVVALELVDDVTVLEVVEDTTLDEELDETDRGPVFW